MGENKELKIDGLIEKLTELKKNGNEKLPEIEITEKNINWIDIAKHNLNNSDKVNENNSNGNQNTLPFYLVYKAYSNKIDIAKEKMSSYVDTKNTTQTGKIFNWNNKYTIYLNTNNSKNIKKILEFINFLMKKNVNFENTTFKIVDDNGNDKGDNKMSNTTDNNKNGKKIDDIVEGAIKDYNQVIFTGAPGTGKTYSVRKYVMGDEKTKTKGVADAEHYEFVQFHPSYDYSDFVEGLRPVKIDGEENSTFVRLDGIFKKFCRKIVDNGDNEPYYFIVDEINRADLSKVFGELMFGLEESYRGKKFDTQYMNLDTYEIDESGCANNIAKNDCFRNGFYIPKNLKFIGTMNDIDRSVESFDFALRRRFRWIDIKVNEILLNSLNDMLKDKKLKEGDISNLTDKINSMNKALTDANLGLSEAYYIGPAYFKEYNGRNLEDIFEKRIEPIIREYVRGRDHEKIDKLVCKCRQELLKDNN